MIEADAAQAQRGFLFASGLGDDHDGLGAVEHGARPGGVLAAESDIDAAGQVALGVFGGIANVQNLRACVSHAQDFVEFDGMQHLFEIVVERRALAGVENGVVREVRRGVGLIGRDQVDEFLFRHGLKRVVETPLLAQRETVSEESFFPHSEPAPCAG